MSNDLATQFNMDEGLLTTLKNMYAKDSTDDEFRVFITLCNKYNLDPMLNEISFVKHKANTRPIMQTTRDGYLKIANRNPNFNGMQGDVIYEGDQIIQNPDGSISIKYGPSHVSFDRSKISGAFCSVFRKDRDKASTVFVSFKDYDKGGMGFGGPWKTHPNAMILKVAEAMALKRAFAINGLLTQEEFDPVERPNTEFKIESVVEETQLTQLGQFKEEYFKLVDNLKSYGNFENTLSKILKDYNIKKLSLLPINKVGEVMATYSPLIIEDTVQNDT